MSKFKNLMAQARQHQDELVQDELVQDELVDETGEAPPDDGAAKQSLPQANAPRTAENATSTPPSKQKVTKWESESATNAELEPMLRRRGRPAGHAGGKRSHPEYEQVSAYLPRQMHREIKLALLQGEVQTGQKQEFSTLVELLLEEWLHNESQKLK